MRDEVVQSQWAACEGSSLDMSALALGLASGATRQTPEEHGEKRGMVPIDTFEI